MLRDVSRRFLMRLAMITGVAGIIRLIYVYKTSDHRVLWGDALFYHRQAEFLVDGRFFIQPSAGNSGGFGSPSADHPPIFTLLLAAANKLGQTSFASHMVVCAIFGTLGVFLIGLLGREIGGERVGYITAVAYAFWVTTWVYDGIVVSESVAIPAAILALLCTYRFIREPSWPRAAWLGVACALGALVRAEIVLILPLVALPIAVLLPKLRGWRIEPREFAWRRRVQWLVITGVVSAAVMGPWVVRNYVTFEEPTYLSTGAGLTMASSTCDITFGGDYLGYWSMACVLDTPMPKGDASVVDAHFRKRAIEYLKEHKSRVPVVIAARNLRVWGWFRPFQQADFGRFDDNREYWLSRWGLGQLYVAEALGLAGFIILRRRRWTVFPLVMPLLIVTVSVTMTFGNTRYRAFADPVLVVLSAVTLDALWQWYRDRRLRRSIDNRDVDDQSGADGADSDATNVDLSTTEIDVASVTGR